MTVEKRTMNCITCPMGCEMTVTIDDGVVINVEGNSCLRGKKYAEVEITAPKRMLTSTVKVKGGILPLLPVVSQEPLPKEKVLACAKELRKISVEAPIALGQVICGNILGLGINIIAARSMKQEEQKV